ncbi:major facilitator superfamily MFS_1 [Arcticibacter svalbardensis MN12-7]|uniref:Major facilitator superfamily MFS_1 n=1 Tax=Arcticibacter svalbardensis MN12-7 TaxID=1150600 RepID=R9GX44_9SPHI|nr:MFS transporter [Arcticibacter svalbardensis]EOR96331.1 major facilitator superfamily MFS_1 [Arcticibacter svalbardensis MN12-7]
MKKSLIPLTLGGLGIGTTEFVMMGLLPDIAKDFQISIPVAGHLISAYALGVVIGAPLLVALSSNIAPKKILLSLMAMFTIFNALSAFAPNNTFLLIARLLSGLPHGAFFGVGSVVASRLADNGKKAQAISVMFAGLTIANLLTVPLGTFIGHTYSWRFTFGIVAIIGLTTLVFIQLWLPKMPVNRAGNIKTELQFFKKTEAWLIILITAIGTGGLFAWISYIAPLMTEVSLFGANQVPYILILAGAGMVVGNIIGGKLADKINPVKACVALLTAMTISLIITFFISENQILSLLLTFIIGALSMAIAAPIQILMISTAKDAEMLGASVTQAAFNIGNALGAFFGGLPIAAGLGYTSPAIVGAIMAFLGVIFAWLLIKKQNAATSEQSIPIEGSLLPN